MATALKQPPLTIRPWTKQDRKALASWPPHQIVAAWANTGTCWGRRESHAILLGGLLIGRITLRDVKPGLEARLGIYLHPDYVSQGYGSAALSDFLHSFFEHSQCMRLDVAHTNYRAVRCYEKVGFEKSYHEFRVAQDGSSQVYWEMTLSRKRWELLLCTR